jgi:hypothetical protein
VSKELFDKAQSVFADLTHRLTNEQMLEKLRAVIREHGRLTHKLINRSHNCPGLTTYCKRFGALRNVYVQLGLKPGEYASSPLSKRQQSLMIRDTLAQQILEKFPNQLVAIRRNRRVRTRLKLRATGLMISMVIGRWHPTPSGKIRWTFYMPERERKNLTIVALLDKDNERVRELWVKPHMKHRTRNLQVREGSHWFSEAGRVGNLDDLLDVVERIQSGRRAKAA